MTELPVWASEAVAEGFNPSLRWLPVVCTGMGKHQVILLGMGYERSAGHVDQHLFLWDYANNRAAFPESIVASDSERSAHAENRSPHTWRIGVATVGTVDEPPQSPTHEDWLWATEQERGKAFRRMGSWTLSCDACDRRVRLAHHDLLAILNRAWDLSVPMVDMSEYS